MDKYTPEECAQEIQGWLDTADKLTLEWDSSEVLKQAADHLRQLSQANKVMRERLEYWASISGSEDAEEAIAQADKIMEGE